MQIASMTVQVSQSVSQYSHESNHQFLNNPVDNIQKIIKKLDPSSTAAQSET